MAVFYNPSLLRKLTGWHLIIDTNILSVCATDEVFLDNIMKVFRSNTRFIDPIVRLEYLRNAYTDLLHKTKVEFLKANKFYEMNDDSSTLTIGVLMFL